MVAGGSSPQRGRSAEARGSGAGDQRQLGSYVLGCLLKVKLLTCVQVEAHAAVSAAEAERSTRAEAEGLSETLRQVSVNGVCVCMCGRVLSATLGAVRRLGGISPRRAPDRDLALQPRPPPCNRLPQTHAPQPCPPLLRMVSVGRVSSTTRSRPPSARSRESWRRSAMICRWIEGGEGGRSGWGGWGGWRWRMTIYSFDL